MKVLFAVNNENISESIIKKYQQEYKEIITAKNVYYFNAIIKELQRDKSYDRIVISEDLEPFSNNNYEAIDKFIFDKLDNISDEATNSMGNDIPIILICADRRNKSEQLLVKLFGIGIYSALLGQDRSITSACNLINKPRTKKEAKVYYHIDSEDVDYKSENEDDVSEMEIQNILSHYKRLGRNEEKYVESFNSIAAQYTDAQLRLIANFLPLNVKAVLEANSPKYQEVMTFNNTKGNANYNNYQSKNMKSDKKNNDPMNLDLIEKNLNQSKMTKPVIIPSAIQTDNIKKIVENHPIEENTKIVENTQRLEEIDDILGSFNTVEESSNSINEVDETEEMQPKRRGRPKKIQDETENTSETDTPKRRGRPKKVQEENDSINTTIPEAKPQPVAPINLFELGDESEEQLTNNHATSAFSDMILPGFDDDEEIDEVKETIQPSNINSQNHNVEHWATENVEQTNNSEDVNTKHDNFAPQNNYQQPINNTYEPLENQEVQNTNYVPNNTMNAFVSKDKKVVAFVGTSKNGTSFLINNLAELLSKKGISTAILDVTKNKNSYYIYTQNEEPLRKIAYDTIENLRRGNPAGIQVNKNLTVFTTLPEEDEGIQDYSNILTTLKQNYSLVLLDCDFDTNYGYFQEAEEIYLVQSLDILTIQPLTACLRDLKAKSVLNPEKIRVVINKMIKVRSINEKTIIGGMAYYNDPAMSFMTELFNKDNVPYTTIPFEDQTYAKYLEGLVNCEITLNGYSKSLLEALAKLESMVFPLMSNNNNNNDKKKKAKPTFNSYNPTSQEKQAFSNDMNNTLNKMKNNY